MISILRTLFEHLSTAGNVYGWRIDAIVIGGILWVVASSFEQARSVLAVQPVQ